ncbi:MAG: hypothetical protein AB1791_22760 [Chloroflexota bacterium]
MTVIKEIHLFLSNTIWLFFLALGLWGLWRAYRHGGVDGSYLGAMIIGEGLFVVQAILGAILWFGGGRPDRGVHILYGIFAIVCLPGAFAYLRGDDSNRAQWIFALLCLFLFGVSLRAIGTS